MVPTAGAAAPKAADFKRGGPTRFVLGAMWAADRHRTVLLCGLVVVTGLAPVAVVLLTGELLGAIERGADDASVVAVVLGLVFLAQLVFRNAQGYVADEVGRRVDSSLQERVMLAVARSHYCLHDPDRASLPGRSVIGGAPPCANTSLTTLQATQPAGEVA